jgi:hypothetical protein
VVPTGTELDGKSVTLEIKGESGTVSTIEAYPVKDLPFDLVLGVDALGQLGTTITFDGEGNSAVTFNPSQLPQSQQQPPQPPQPQKKQQQQAKKKQQS